MSRKQRVTTSGSRQHGTCSTRRREGAIVVEKSSRSKYVRSSNLPWFLSNANRERINEQRRQVVQEHNR